MTVASTTNRKTFVGDDATTSFATSPVVFFATSDLQVYVTTDATGASTLLTEGVGYTVSGGDVTSGAVGTVDTSGGSSPHGALLSGTTLVILRELPLLQGADFVQNDASDAEVAEAALDKLIMIQQRLDEKLDRSLRLADGDVTGLDPTLPALGNRGDKVLGFNTAGDELELKGAVDNTLLAAQLASTASGNGAAMVGFVQSGSATSRTAQSKLREIVSPEDDGAAGDGT
ncbi:MAG: hypothetical protein OEZ09_07365, partial [Betaproteobacteria bacterium]|nr:hypothetical protein [Betaproteobacteria bacterium]